MIRFSIVSLALTVGFSASGYAVSSSGRSKIIPAVQPPIVKEFTVDSIKARLVTDKKNKALLDFMLGVAYFKNENYAVSYKTLNKNVSIQYLDDYIKYYRAAAAFKGLSSAGVLKKSLDDFYSILDKGLGAVVDEVKNGLPEAEFKTALAYAGINKYEASINYYARARNRKYSDLKSEFELVKLYLKYNRDMALSFFLDIARRFDPTDVKNVFGALPDKIKTEIFSLTNYTNGKTETVQADYRKSESDLISALKYAVDSKDAEKVKNLAEEYLKNYPQGSYSKRFYQVVHGFIEDTLFNKTQSVSFYEPVFNNYYDKTLLDKLVVKMFQKTDLKEVETLLNIILKRNPLNDKAIYLLASLYEDKGENARGLKYYKEIVNGFPQGPYYQRSLFKYAWLEMLDGNNRDCSDLFSRYIEEGQDNYDWSTTAALYFKSQCLQKRSRTDESKTATQELINKYPYSFYSLISMENESTSLVEHITKNIKPLNSSSEAISPQDLVTLRTVIMLIKAGMTEMATKELAYLDLDKLSPGYVDVVTSIYKYSANPDLAIMAAGKLMNSLKGYASMGHAEVHFPKYYFDNVRKFSEAYKVPPFIMLAIMKRESAFKKDAVSSAGALGLMQMMPDVASSVDPNVTQKSLKDPDGNIKVAAVYLKNLMGKYNGNLIYVLASYNAGDEALTRWINWYGDKLSPIEFIENMPYLETRNYVKSVISNYYMYNALYLKKDIKFSEVLKTKYNGAEE